MDTLRKSENLSNDALNLAFSANIKNSSMKFVLVALADYANDDFLVYPSIQTVTKKTGLNRKTILSAFDYFSSVGVLVDTGQRKGQTKQVKVYRMDFSALPTIHIKLVHYVYKIQNQVGQFYIGVRTASIEAQKDRYMGSGNWIQTQKSNHLDKLILAEFDSRELAEAFEISEIYKFRHDALCMNIDKREPKSELLNSPKNNSTELGQETVPNLPKKALKQSQKRYSEPSDIKPSVEPLVLPEWLNEKYWYDFRLMRIKMKKPMTAEAERLNIKKLGDWMAQGHDPTEVLKNSIMNSYQGLFEPKQKKGQPSAKQSNSIDEQTRDLLERIRTGEYN